MAEFNPSPHELASSHERVAPHVGVDSASGDSPFRQGGLEAELVESTAPRSAYQVPRRFGLASLLTLFTTFSFLFAALRYWDAPSVVYWFLASLALAIGGCQMLFQREPRLVSVLAGAVFLPAVVFISLLGMWLGRGVPPRGEALTAAICALLGTLPVGGFAGYCIGTLLAGVFLVMDLAVRLSLRLTGEAGRSK